MQARFATNSPPASRSTCTGKQPDNQRRILARLDASPRNERPVISAVVLSELRYGVRKSRWRKALIHNTREFARVKGLRLEDWVG